LQAKGGAVLDGKLPPSRCFFKKGKFLLMTRRRFWLPGDYVGLLKEKRGYYLI